MVEFTDAARDAKMQSANQASIAAFLDSGMALTDLFCLDYFNRVTKNHQHRGFTRAFLNDTNGLVSAIMGLTQAGSLATGAVGASFSFANSTAENVESNYMVSVDMASAQELTKDAMSKLAAHYRDKAPPATYYEAERDLANYASICTFTGIHGLIAKSVRASKIEVNKKGEFQFAAPSLTGDTTSDTN
jgi:hypothetical protein